MADDSAQKRTIVERSFSKMKWVMDDIDFDDVQNIMRHHDISEAAARMLCARGVAFEGIERFLNPTLANNFPDPMTLKDMDAAADYFADAIIKNRFIAIFGDFDVDGATSSAILYRFLKYCGMDAPIYIPDRLTEGYGPNINALRSLKEKGAEIVVLLDCGTTSFETVEKARATGLEVVIVDHHEAEITLPDANFVINPKRQDDQSGFDALAACGVTFLFCVAINGVLRDRGFYKDKDIKQAPLKGWLDLVALGTVCDMVPLTGANRLFVRQGFANMAQTANVGLKALIDTGGLSGAITPYHAGFVLGPRINAGSRVHRSDLGATLLSTDDAEEARDIAWQLNDCNDKRKAMQANMEREAIAQVEQHGMQDHPVILVQGEGWHSGLSGLVAGRLKEKYKKPACVIAFVKNGEGGMEGRGSGRSIPGIHLANAFIDARKEGLLIKGGGHAMAGGFSISPDKIEDFKVFLTGHVENQMKDVDAVIQSDLDGVLSMRGLRPDFIKKLNSFIGPFGQGNPEPVFAFKNTRIYSADIVGVSHIRLLASDWEGGTRIKVMAFRAVDTPLGDALLKHSKRSFNLIGSVKVDNWSGQDRAEIHLKDAAFSFSEELVEEEHSALESA